MAAHTETDRHRSRTSFPSLGAPQVDECGGFGDEGELKPEEIADVAEIAIRLEKRVRENVDFVVKPVMSRKAVMQLVAARAKLGKNPAKRGALMQGDKKGAYTEFSKEETELGQFLRNVDATVAASFVPFNRFGRLQQGTVRLGSGPKGRSGPGGGSAGFGYRADLGCVQTTEGLWHTDKEVDPMANARIIFHFGPEGSSIGTSFRFKEHPEIVFDVVPPAGAGMVIRHELTLDPEVEHKHTGSGERSLSLIHDGARRAGIDDVGATMQSLADAAAQQRLQPINFRRFKWRYSDFKGKWRKGGAGGGSTRRCAVSGVAGPVRGGRGSRRTIRLPTARAKVAAMSASELKRAAAIPIDRQFLRLTIDPTTGGTVRTIVEAKEWKQLPEEERDLINGGGAADKGT